MHTITGLLLTPGQQPQPATVATRPGQQQYQAIQHTLAVHTFDVVGLTHGIDLFVDDEGAITGRPLNLPATVLAHTLGTPAVLFGPALALAVDDHGGTIRLSPDQTARIRRAIERPDPAVLATITRTLRDAGYPHPH